MLRNTNIEKGDRDVKRGSQGTLTGQVTFEERPMGHEGTLPHGHTAGKEREFQQMQKL